MPENNRDRDRKSSTTAAQITASLQSLRFECGELKDFELRQVLGTGSFGRVSLAAHKKTGHLCAIKCLSKAHILKNQQQEHLRSEREVLNMLEHPFIVRLLGSFQTEECIYLVMDYVAGGWCGISASSMLVEC